MQMSMGRLVVIYISVCNTLSVIIWMNPLKHSIHRLGPDLPVAGSWSKILTENPVGVASLTEIIAPVVEPRHSICMRLCSSMNCSVLGMSFSIVTMGAAAGAARSSSCRVNRPCWI